MSKLSYVLKPSTIAKLDFFENNFIRQLSIYHRNNQKKECKPEDQRKAVPVKCPAEKTSKEDCIVPPCVPPCSTVLPKVVIVGAGMAGLSAAQRLVKCGITDFTVIEANDRPGGRIHSCWMDNVVAELGAQWIFGGCITNPTFTLACQEDLVKSPVYSNVKGSGLFVTSDGRAIDHRIGKATSKVFKEIEEEAYTLFSTNSGRDHGSLLNFLSVRIQQELQKFPENQRYDVARMMFGLTNSVRCRWGADLSQMSADQFGSYIEIPGGSIGVPQGYIGVLAPLIRDIPPCNIKYCKPVKTIRWGATSESSPKASVVCCDGEEFPADYVIVTVSLGVLKTQAEKLFVPTLPEEKLEAIKNLGFGCINHIFLQYSKPFWLSKQGKFNLAWSMDELSERDEWVKGVCSLKEIPGNQHVLQVCVSGREATVSENLSDKDIAEDLTRLLRQFTGDQTVPYPINILRSKWSSDPFFVGSNSFMALDSTVGHQCDLGSPVPGASESEAPILLFAGEATCPGQFSTVHGARVSGVREAERVIHLTKNKSCSPQQQQQEKTKEACST